MEVYLVALTKAHLDTAFWQLALVSFRPLLGLLG